MRHLRFMIMVLQLVVTVTAGRSWSFTFDKDLTLGKHSITLTQTDAAGLTSEASSPFTFMWLHRKSRVWLMLQSIL